MPRKKMKSQAAARGRVHEVSSKARIELAFCCSSTNLIKRFMEGAGLCLFNENMQMSNVIRGSKSTKTNPARL